MFIFNPFLIRPLLLLLGLTWALSANAEKLLIIASPLVPENAVSVKELADIYIMKKQNWSNGIRIIPVNREVSSMEREVFSKEVFDLSPEKLSDYWARLRFQGKLPPSVQTSDDAVLNFVKSIPGAIGYIGASHLGKDDRDVKILLTLP